MDNQTYRSTVRKSTVAHSILWATQQVAQRSVFAAALKAEIIQLRERFQVAEQHREQRRRRCVAEAETPEGLVRLRAQLDRHGC
jgi:hypothetical protein